MLRARLRADDGFTPEHTSSDGDVRKCTRPERAPAAPHPTRKGTAGDPSGPHPSCSTDGRRRPMKLSMVRARLLSSESGFALIEAIVSAAVLAIIAMAVLSGIDAASSSSAREKARAVAAILAEQDQEMMRSMDVDKLAAINSTPRTVPIDGADYKVTSKAEWITDDAGGTPACGNSSKNNEYLHITTTRHIGAVGTRTKPVVIDSLVAPSTQVSSTHGILGIKVVDRNAVGVPGASVTATSTSPSVSQTGTTDANGCVIFKQLPVATYTVTVSKGGYVGTDLETTVTVSQKATPGTVMFKTIDVRRRDQRPRHGQDDAAGRRDGPAGDQGDQGLADQCEGHRPAEDLHQRRARELAGHRSAVPVQGHRLRLLHRQLRLPEPRYVRQP